MRINHKVKSLRNFLCFPALLTSFSFCFPIFFSLSISLSFCHSLSLLIPRQSSTGNVNSWPLQPRDESRVTASSIINEARFISLRTIFGSYFFSPSLPLSISLSLSLSLHFKTLTNTCYFACLKRSHLK